MRAAKRPRPVSREESEEEGAAVEEELGGEMFGLVVVVGDSAPWSTVRRLRFMFFDSNV